MNDTVTQKIPHRPPFLFVDKVLERREDGLVAEHLWRADSAFYAGHYPGNPLTPGVLLCESVFQAAAVFLADKMPAGEKTVPVLGRIHGAKFKNMVRPGAVTTIEVKLGEVSQNKFFTLHGIVRQDGKLVLSVDFTVAMLAEENPQS